MTDQSTRELHFLRVWRLAGDGRQPELQFEFHEDRKWRFDFAWPAERVAVEIDGGTRGRPVICHVCSTRVRARTRNGVGRELRLGGGHNRGKAYFSALEKQNSAVLLGWRLYRVPEKDLDERPVQVCEDILKLLGTPPCPNPEAN